MNTPSAISSSDNRDIRPLQYGRGVAAFLVCVFHFEEAKQQIQPAAATGVGSIDLNHIFRAGHSGVEFFFILSGFIIFYAHRYDLNRSDRLISFYQKRAIRILPMFWLIVIPIGLAILAISSTTALTPGTFLLDILLIPREGTLILPTAWTLQHELVFYVLFGLLILNKRLGIIVLALWQAVCLIVLIFNLLPQNYALPASTYVGYFNFGFVFGIMVAYLYGRIDFGAYHRGFVALGGIGFAGLLVCFVGECRYGSDMFFPSPAASTLIYFALYSLVILALLSVENKPRPILDMTLGALGGASYILYLIHLPLGSILSKLFLLPALHPLAGSTFAFTLSVGAAVAISISMHYGIERPVLRWLRRRLLRSSRSSNAITTMPKMMPE